MSDSRIYVFDFDRFAGLYRPRDEGIRHLFRQSRRGNGKGSGGHCRESDRNDARLRGHVQGVRQALGQELSAELDGNRHGNRRTACWSLIRSCAVDVHNPQHKLQRRNSRQRLSVRARKSWPSAACRMGTGGKAALLLSGGIDSPVAGYQLMKRGVRCCAIHFQSPPYTGELARDKVMQLAKELGGVLRRHARVSGAVYEVPARDPRKVPRRTGHADYPPLHDAHRREDRAQGLRRAGADHRRKPRPGGLSDHGGARLHRRGGATCPCSGR